MRFYDRTGAELPDMFAWADLRNDRAYPFLAVTALASVDGVGVVTTAWIGHDLSPGLADRPPLIFETAAVGYDGVPVFTRWATEDAAMQGHEDAVTRLAESMVLPVLSERFPLRDSVSPAQVVRDDRVIGGGPC